MLVLWGVGMTLFSARQQWPESVSVPELQWLIKTSGTLSDEHHTAMPFFTKPHPVFLPFSLMWIDQVRPGTFSRSRKWVIDTTSPQRVTLIPWCPNKFDFVGPG